MTQLLDFEHMMMIVLFKSWHSFNHKTATKLHRISSLISGTSGSIAVFLYLGHVYIISDIKRDLDKRRCQWKSICCIFHLFILEYL